MCARAHNYIVKRQVNFKFTTAPYSFIINFFSPSWVRTNLCRQLFRFSPHTRLCVDNYFGEVKHERSRSNCWTWCNMSEIRYVLFALNHAQARSLCVLGLHQIVCTTAPRARSGKKRWILQESVSASKQKSSPFASPPPPPLCRCRWNFHVEK